MTRTRDAHIFTNMSTLQIIQICLEAHRAVSIGSEICEQDRGSDRNMDRSSSIDNDGPYVSLFELAPISPLSPDQENPPELSMPSSVALLQAGVGEEEEQERDLITVSGLVAELRAQRKELEAARAELEAERRGKAEAVEQGELDREAARLAMQLVHEAEAEKHGLQRRLEACSVKAQLYDAAAAMDAAAGLGDVGDLPEPEKDGNGNGNGGNNYQSLVDFFPGSAVYSSSPDLANLLKLYTEGNGGGRRRSMESVMDDDASAVVAVAEEEEVVAVVVAAAVSDSNGGNRQTAGGIDGASP
ncbi:hypothetical protein BRADI_4g07370v3 [Brachypodium distachyon]|uniref:GTD-binding domain-containing protein n=1 Tax=Brachypodium distachyon TaxID=15368 RepID=A0A0Q3HEL8_BRADI|nr:hypothetical protein BRADI_4g07370v3 [Brachypodium distachyon]